MHCSFYSQGEKDCVFLRLHENSTSGIESSTLLVDLFYLQGVRGALHLDGTRKSLMKEVEQVFLVICLTSPEAYFCVCLIFIASLWLVFCNYIWKITR